ncbi:MAG: hypothetical protein L0Z07_01040, partial [Planctomycetes bacterium]|nr:hypothetical protein [Planctomycetota bacterium]
DIFVLRGPLPSDQGSSDRTKETTADDGTASEQRPAADEQTPLEGWQPIRLHGREQEDQSVTFVDRRTGTRHVVAYEPKSIARLQNDPNYVTVAQGSQGEMGIEDDNSRPLPPDSGEWFVQHALGLGGVRAFRGPWDPLPEIIVPIDADGEIELMRRLPPEIRMSLRTVRNWTSRHGLAPDQASQDFADFLVPGVGLAPVTEFRVFITLFVLLIGPFNYWLLKRLGRLHLLVLTVPLAAALMTGSLFAYAILSDGFRTSVRVRSLTTLDQRTGEAACWAWLSYYSGLAPAQGFTFPSDVAVYPIIPDWYDATTDADMGTMREVLWEPSAGRYTRGWLRSRTPTQYLTVRARQSAQRIEFVPVKDELRATNELGTTIRYLVALDRNRKLFVGEHIRPGEKVILQPTERNEAISRIRQFLLENPPKAPAALAGNDSDFAIFERSWRQQSRSGLARSAVRLSDNLLNRALAELGGLGGSPALQLTPKSYIAITETAPEVAIGLESFLEAASFHVVIGDW